MTSHLTIDSSGFSLSLHWMLTLPPPKNFQPLPSPSWMISPYPTPTSLGPHRYDVIVGPLAGHHKMESKVRGSLKEKESAATSQLQSVFNILEFLDNI